MINEHDYETIEVYCTVDDLDYIEPMEFVTVTTSELPYNMVSERFDNDVEHLATIKGLYHDSDYSEYDEDKCRNGGCYGFDSYRIQSIEWYDDVGLLSLHSMLSNKLSEWINRNYNEELIESLRDEIEDLEITIKKLERLCD